MKDGYIQQVGTPYELYFNPANLFVAGFIGEPPMNFVKCQVNNGCVKIGSETIDIKENLKGHEDYEGKEVWFGFRPEDILLGEHDGCVLKGNVELTEMLGDSTNVYVTMEDVNTILKVNPFEAPKMDEDISFTIPHKKIYLFDVDTEEVLSREE